MEVADYRRQVQRQEKALEDHREYESSMAEHWQKYRQYREKVGAGFRRNTFSRSTHSKEEISTRTGPYLGLVLKGRGWPNVGLSLCFGLQRSAFWSI